jgi:hypothetical protein
MEEEHECILKQRAKENIWTWETQNTNGKWKNLVIYTFFLWLLWHLNEEDYSRLGM